jgi:hypothetical protein
MLDNTLPVLPTLHTSHKLFQTWSEYFPNGIPANLCTVSTVIQKAASTILYVGNNKDIV